MTEAANLAMSAFEAVCDERDRLIAENDEMRKAIYNAHWQLLPFLKPNDKETKKVIEQLQKFL